MLDKGKVNYSYSSIIQASDLKKRLEEQKIKRDKVTIASVAAIIMYPLIKISTIERNVRFFARKLTAENMKTIKLYLELIHSGMSSALITFDVKYYEYQGGEKEEQRLAIGGCESEFLADLVAYYLF